MAVVGRCEVDASGSAYLASSLARADEDKVDAPSGFVSNSGCGGGGGGGSGGAGLEEGEEEACRREGGDDWCEFGEGRRSGFRWTGREGRVVEGFSGEGRGDGR